MKEAWGKNQFNTSFPASLCCFLHSEGHKAAYLALDEFSLSHSEVCISEAFGIDPLAEDVYFAFESLHTPFQKYVIGTLPRTDLVIQARSSGQCLAAFEIKLTALPDNSTCELPDSEYGSEIVVRPDTIVYLACSIADGIEEDLKATFDEGGSVQVEDWSDASQVFSHVPHIIATLKRIAVNLGQQQIPFLLHPVWKTIGKSPVLADNCLDVFFWSNAGFLHFISEVANSNVNAVSINRQTRTAIWVFKMLLDIANQGRFDFADIIDNLSYNTRNDKAFACSGNVTRRFMNCHRLTSPLVPKDKIKQIILGGGQNLLSPERRLDAIIVNSPELFNA